MKKWKLFLTSLMSCAAAVGTVNANILYNDNISTSFTNKEDTTGLAYSINEFVCYSCGLEQATDNSGGKYYAAGVKSNGIGIYFDNNGKWETGSAMLSSANSRFGNNALTSFFVAASLDGVAVKTGDGTSAQKFSDHSLLTNINNGSLSKDLGSGITVSVTPELLKNKRYIKLNYKVVNTSSSAQNVYISTFNDIYIGGIPESTCNDTAKYVSNATFSPIKTGFNAFTGGSKYMTVILQENNNQLGGIISDGGGTFKHYFGDASAAYKSGTDPAVDSTMKQNNNLYQNIELPFTNTTGDSEFAYSWNKSVEPGETTFSTLIGLGNLEDVAVTVDKDKISPNYNQDKAQFTLTTDDKQIHIGGTITDKCGMGKCTYTINGKGPFNCDDEIYYTDSSFKTTYNTGISTDYLSNTDENTFVVKAESVACGTATAEHKFTLYNDQKKNPQMGINTNYIALGIILMGGIGLYIYSRKQNKFPQV